LDLDADACSGSRCNAKATNPLDFPGAASAGLPHGPRHGVGYPAEQFGVQATGQRNRSDRAIESKDDAAMCA
jgi:hypothetical protein